MPSNILLLYCGATLFVYTLGCIEHLIGLCAKQHVVEWLFIDSHTILYVCEIISLLVYSVTTCYQFILWSVYTLACYETQITQYIMIMYKRLLHICVLCCACCVGVLANIPYAI